MGLGVYITSQKVFFFSKNGRGLGFSDTKERKSRIIIIMPVTNTFGEKMSTSNNLKLRNNQTKKYLLEYDW